MRLFPVLAGLLAVLSTIPAAPVIAAPPQYAEGRLLVQPRAGLSNDEFRKILRKSGASPRREIKPINLHVVNVPPQAEDAVAQALSRSPHVVFAEKDRAVELTAITPDDPRYPDAWHLPMMELPSAWETSTGNGTVVAVLDTGVDSSHPDLFANLITGTNAVDGYSDTSDIHGHGTRVSGVVAATSNNATGVASIAWDSVVMPIRVTNSSDGVAYFSDIANGLVWAADHGADVANISYDVTASSSVNSAAQYMMGKGGVVVVAAGNSGSNPGYSDSPYMISVSATDSSDTKTSWSSYGDYVDVAAPGAGIITTSKGGGYASVSGTSFASPATAAVAALIRSANPGLAPADIEAVLEQSAVDLGLEGRDTFYGYGRVDAAAALQLASDSTATDTQAPFVQINSPGEGATVEGIVPVDVGASDDTGVVQVDLYANGVLVGSDVDAPYAFSWDSTPYAGSEIQLTAYAFDAENNRGESVAITVYVPSAEAGDVTPPELTITNPADGSTVEGRVTVSATAADESPISQLVIYAGGKMLCAVDTNSASCTWNTRKYSGSQTVSASAVDAAGNQASVSIQVTVGSDGGGGTDEKTNNGKGNGKNK